MDNTKMDILGWTAKIVSESSRLQLSAELGNFIIEAMEQNMITIYEAFQLMEICDRIIAEKYNHIAGAVDSVQSLNMALMAKLFNENALYEQFCRDARERLDIWLNDLKKHNRKRLEDYILDDLEGFLSGDLEHMEKLSYIRKHAEPDETHHFEYFPYDYLKYEDELIKILNGETDHYEVDKTISPEICDMMTAIELRAMELYY